MNFDSSNSTRFIVVTNQKVFLKDAAKVSICFEVPHESGFLYQMLSHFIYNHLNITKIESRPIEGRTCEYRFFVDFECNLADGAVKNALRGLRDEARSLRILGNYSRKRGGERMRTNELMLYKHMEQESILDDMTFLMDNYDNAYYNKEDLKSLLFECMNALLELAASHGFEGNLWHTYLTYLLANHENAYSTACEIVGEIEGSINEVALHDFEIFKELFDYDFQKLENALEASCFSVLFGYKNPKGQGKVYNKRIRDRICDLSVHLGKAQDAAEFKKVLTNFYKEFGVGKFGLHKAFRVERKDGEVDIVPITKIAHVNLDDLVGYEIAKQKLTDNTRAFVEGKRANNCLLYGDAGTGKSTSIKAVLNQYYDQGLRMIEVYKHQFQDLNDVIAKIKDRNYKFIIYMDDLSFEEFEIEYKYLKAVIE